MFVRDDLDVAHSVGPAISNARHLILAAAGTTFVPMSGLLPNPPPLIEGHGKGDAASGGAIAALPKSPIRQARLAVCEAPLMFLPLLVHPRWIGGRSAGNCEFHNR